MKKLLPFLLICLSSLTALAGNKDEACLPAFPMGLAVDSWERGEYLSNKADSLHLLAEKAKREGNMFYYNKVIYYDSLAEDYYLKAIKEFNNPFLDITMTSLIPCWANLGSAYMASGQYFTAYLYFKRIVDYNKENDFVPSDTLNYLTTVSNDYQFLLRIFYEDYGGMGDRRVAIKLLEEAMRFAKLVGDDYNVETCQRWITHLMMPPAPRWDKVDGDTAKTMAKERQALEEFRKNEGIFFEDALDGLEYEERHYRVLRTLARLSYETGDKQQAFAYAKELTDLERKKMLMRFATVGSSTRMTYWQKFNADFYMLSRYAADCPTASGAGSTVYDYNALFSKGLILESDRTLLQMMSEQDDKFSINLYLGMAKDKSRMASALLRNDMKNLQELNELIFEKTAFLAQDFDGFTRSLDPLDPYKNSKGWRRTTWQDVQQCLGDSDIAVEFIDFPTDSDRQYAALTLCKGDSVPTMTKLFTESHIDDIPGVADGLSPHIFRTDTIYNMVWRPLADRLSGRRNIYFSPSGILNNLGIEYFPQLASCNLFRLSSTRELVTHATQRAEDNKQDLQARRAKAGAVLYGGLDYGNAEQAPAVMRAVLRNAGPLAYSKEEVDGIATALKTADIPCRVITGKDGTKQNFLSLSGSNSTIIHVSTHGFYYSEADSAQLSRHRLLQLISADRDYFSPEDRSLSRSALILAPDSATHGGQGASADDSSILTAAEIANMDLRGLDIVSLSACQTALGDLRGSEGVFGLQRGSKKAGAQTILMSLWEVDDRATQLLMCKFYECLAHGHTKQQALKMAQQYLRTYPGADYSDPKYWAAFILLDALK